MPDDAFDFPSTLSTLAGVPDALRDCYEAAGAGFALTQQAGDALAVHLAEVAALETAHAAAMGAADRAIAERTDTLHGMIARTAIGDAFDAQGVPGKIAPAGLALFLTTHKVEIEPADDGDGHVALIRDGFGLRSVEASVGAWLSSDEGRVYAPTPKFRGEFGAMISALRTRG
ncbi:MULTISPECIES: hypothetical protein [unclassified Mesorhizobium]|uniref:hypothetical protein n=1 Tax=unclassified Mesorhizobium TaxID=325217 RepID=UPI00333552B0